MANKELKNVGTCAYCGQTRVIETLGDFTQKELDRMATERCLCQGA